VSETKRPPGKTGGLFAGPGNVSEESVFGLGMIQRQGPHLARDFFQALNVGLEGPAQFFDFLGLRGNLPLNVPNL